MSTGEPPDGAPGEPPGPEQGQEDAPRPRLRVRQIQGTHTPGFCIGMLDMISFIHKN